MVAMLKNSIHFPRVEQAIQDLRAGKMIILTDDADRENEGDIVVAAEALTNDIMTFIIKKASGLVCAALDHELAQHFALNLMVQHNQESMKTAFTVSIDAREGITTGISAADRTTTLRLLADSNATAQSFVKPGHIFPIIARPNGLKERRGHTEASVTLMHYSGQKPVAVICEIIGDDGAMLRGQALQAFAHTYDLTLISIEELVQYSDNQS